MTEHTRPVGDILQDRLATIQKISQATAEHLRLMQRHSGMQVLEMRAEGEAEVRADIGQSEGALERCEDEIAALEGRLADLDDELEASLGGENQ